MAKKRHIPDLEQESLKKSPFGVPEGYFETFPGRLKERIREEEAARVPERRIGHPVRFAAALAAAIVGVALISYTILRQVAGNGNGSTYPDIALLEEMMVVDDSDYMLEILEEESTAASDEEAYINQAMDYLATSDVEMNLIFE